MTAVPVYEILGYAASALVAASLCMRSILRLRVLNLAGAVCFAGYGVLIGAWPVFAVNLFIVGVNLFYLRGMIGSDEAFQLLPVHPQDEYLQRFLRFYESDILRHEPSFERGADEDDLALLVLRDLVPAGVLVARRIDDATLLVRLDYVTPRYRDLKAARFLYGTNLRWFTDQGIRRVRAAGGSEGHRAYLEKMGFAPLGGDRFEKCLDAPGDTLDREEL